MPTTSAASSKNAADYYIHNLPGAPASPRLDMYSGHIEVDAEHHGNLFFWLIKNRHIADRQRTVLWFNGGPGCSSMDGALMEVGPYRVQKDGTLKLQDGSWDEFANVVFVDQPVGTGFSYADTNSFPHEMDTVAATMVTFLTNFYELFPELEHDDVSSDDNNMEEEITDIESCRSISQASPTQDNGSPMSQMPWSNAMRRVLPTTGTSPVC
jgi:carboxypeptidase D